jgi:tyrosine-specific transport protein
VYLCATLLVTLEVSWLSLSSASAASSVQGDEKGSGGGGGAGFLSISRMLLGPPGKAITALLFWFLLTAIIVTFTSKGGMLISRSAKGFASAEIDPAIGLLLFAASFASLAVYGKSGVDAVNRVFVFGPVIAFVGLVGFDLPNVEVSNSTNSANWGIIYPQVISIGILSQGAQNVVPTLLRYLDYNPLIT